MDRKKYIYVPVSLSDEIRDRVKAMAKEHRRSVAQEGGELLELGLKEYETREAPEPART